MSKNFIGKCKVGVAAIKEIDEEDDSVQDLEDNKTIKDHLP